MWCASLLSVLMGPPNMTLAAPFPFQATIGLSNSYARVGETLTLSLVLMDASGVNTATLGVTQPISGNPISPFDPPGSPGSQIGQMFLYVTDPTGTSTSFTPGFDPSMRTWEFDYLVSYAGPHHFTWYMRPYVDWEIGIRPAEVTYSYPGAPASAPGYPVPSSQPIAVASGSFYAVQPEAPALTTAVSTF